MNARTGSLPWDLSGRTKTPEEYKTWLEKQAYKQRKIELQAKEPIKSDKDQDSTT